MKRNNKIITSLILLPILILSFTSCSEKEKETETGNDANTITKDVETGEEVSSVENITESDEAEQYFAKTFDGITLGGEDFMFLTMFSSSPMKDYVRFDHEGMTGEPVDDAIYYQVVTVEDKLDVNIDYYASADVKSEVMNAVKSGDRTYKAVEDLNTSIANLVISNYLTDLNKLDYIDFDNPWWNENYKEKLTVAGKTYLAFGDIFFDAGIKNVHIFYFNKEMCDSYNIEYPYQAVYDGKWTMDYIISLVGGVSKDLNGDGIMDQKDQWGLVQSPIQSSIIYYTSGFTTMSYDEDGYPYLNMWSDVFVKFYEKLYSLDYKTEGVWTNTQADEDNNFQMFADGKVLLCSDFLSKASRVREVEFDVGILPYPKYEESGEYVNWPTGGNHLMGVPSVIDSDEYDFVGIVLEALSVTGYEYVRPALYEVTLQGKLARDHESQDMIDLIFDTMSIDFGWIHTGDSGMGWFVNSCLVAKLENISSFYKRTESRAAKYYNKIVDYYRAMN